VCTHIIWLTKRKLTYYTGNYDTFQKTVAENEVRARRAVCVRVFGLWEGAHGCVRVRAVTCARSKGGGSLLGVFALT
jgi:hypothetical protein